jgi:3-dehydroquinate synthetase
MAEVAKIAMTLDDELFGRLEACAAQLAPTSGKVLEPFVTRAIQLKAGVVERDERETGERLLLNYGHTIGHALEAASEYGSLLHGEAVAIGMRGAAQVAQRMGMLGSAGADRQRQLLGDLRLPEAWARVSVDAVVGALSVDKKRVRARQRWVLAERVGRARVRDDVPEELVRDAVQLVVGEGDG